MKIRNIPGSFILGTPRFASVLSDRKPIVSLQGEPVVLENMLDETLAPESSSNVSSKYAAVITNGTDTYEVPRDGDLSDIDSVKPEHLMDYWLTRNALAWSSGEQAGDFLINGIETYTIPLTQGVARRYNTITIGETTKEIQGVSSFVIRSDESKLLLLLPIKKQAVGTIDVTVDLKYNGETISSTTESFATTGSDFHIGRLVEIPVPKRKPSGVPFSVVVSFSQDVEFGFPLLVKSKSNGFAFLEPSPTQCIGLYVDSGAEPVLFETSQNATQYFGIISVPQFSTRRPVYKGRQIERNIFIEKNEIKMPSAWSGEGNQERLILGQIIAS